jgi:hypothetical protein
MPARGQCDSRSPRRGTESALGWRVVVRTLQPPRRGKTSRQGVRLGKRSWGAPSPLAVAPFCDVFQAAAVASLRSRAARRPSSQGQYVSVCAMMLDRDTPKGTALMSWWPTLEWPDARQCESCCRERAFRARLRRHVWLPSRVGVARYASVRNVSGRRRDFEGQLPRRPPRRQRASLSVPAVTVTTASLPASHRHAIPRHRALALPGEIACW